METSQVILTDVGALKFDDGCYKSYVPESNMKWMNANKQLSLGPTR